MLKNLKKCIKKKKQFVIFYYYYDDEFRFIKSYKKDNGYGWVEL